MYNVNCLSNEMSWKFHFPINVLKRSRACVYNLCVEPDVLSNKTDSICLCMVDRGMEVVRIDKVELTDEASEMCPAANETNGNGNGNGILLTSDMHGVKSEVVPHLFQYQNSYQEHAVRSQGSLLVHHVHHGQVVTVH